ncbi:hypothetical protein [Amycolatopsis thailandensis]|uniref:hypothetical protein n=1 Tax=Amycolatopsis thailandensis TaxID=589330 RepID=UPI00364170B5
MLFRHDLVGRGYRRFKELLLECIDLITAEVSWYAPAVTVRCVGSCRDAPVRTRGWFAVREEAQLATLLADLSHERGRIYGR